jgi:hypothetical protein
VAPQISGNFSHYFRHVRETQHKSVDLLSNYHAFEKNRSNNLATSRSGYNKPLKP